MLKVWFWDVFNAGADVVGDASATGKHVRLLFKHPIVQRIVNYEDGQSALLQLETVEALLKIEEGAGGAWWEGVVGVFRP